MVMIVNIKRIQTVQWKLNNEMAFTILQVGIINPHIIIKKLPNKGGIKEKTIKFRFSFYSFSDGYLKREIISSI